MVEVGHLVLLRHGESTFNASGRFTGLTDVPLTSLRESEASIAAGLLREANFRPDVVFTSVLERALRTADIVLSELGDFKATTVKSWQLNERNYGALTGRSKTEVLQGYGRKQFISWRRSLSAQPPPLDGETLRSLRQQAAFRRLPTHEAALAVGQSGGT